MPKSIVPAVAAQARSDDDVIKWVPLVVPLCAVLLALVVYLLVGTVL